MVSRSEGMALPGLGLSWRQLAGLAGVVGVILFVVGVGLQADSPFADKPADEVRDWYADNGATYLIGSLVVAIGVILFLLPFFAHLRHVLAKAEGGDATWSRVSYLGAVVWLIMSGVGATVLAALATDAAMLEDDSAILLLQYVGYSFFAISPLALVPLFVGAGVVILRTRVFPSWMGWLGLALAVVSFIAAIGAIDVTTVGVLQIMGPVALGGLGVEILALSVAMLRTKES